MIQITMDKLPELITNEDLDKSIESAKKMAEERNIETPMVIITTRDKHGKNEEVTIAMLAVQEAWNETEVKNNIMRELATKIYEQAKVPIIIHLISEAWISRRKKNDKSPIGMPRDDPNREEAIIVATLTLDGKSRLSTRPKNDRMILWNSMKAESELLTHFYRQYARHTLGTGKYPPSQSQN